MGCFSSCGMLWPTKKNSQATDSKEDPMKAIFYEIGCEVMSDDIDEVINEIMKEVENEPSKLLTGPTRETIAKVMKATKKTLMNILDDNRDVFIKNNLHSCMEKWREESAYAEKLAESGVQAQLEDALVGDRETVKKILKDSVGSIVEHMKDEDHVAFKKLARRTVRFSQNWFFRLACKLL